MGTSIVIYGAAWAAIAAYAARMTFINRRMKRRLRHLQALFDADPVQSASLQSARRERCERAMPDQRMWSQS
jgi:hypothetical protein